MANINPWLKHDNNAHNDVWLRHMVRTQGHVAGWMWWVLLELLHKHGKGNELVMNLSDLSHAVASSNSVVTRVLTQMATEFQGQSKLSFQTDGSQFYIEIKNFRNKQHNFKSKCGSNGEQMDGKISKDVDVDVDVENNILRNRGSAGVVEASKPKAKKERTTKHGGELLKAVVGRFLELKGVAGTAIGKDPDNWGRWMKEADALLSELYGRVELADECMTEFSVKWVSASEWGLPAITRHARLWLAEKQAQHSVVGGKG